MRYRFSIFSTYGVTVIKYFSYSTLKQLKGRFHYRNGTLNSNDIAANWLGQPVKFSFNTKTSLRQAAVPDSAVCNVFGRPRNSAGAYSPFSPTFTRKAFSCFSVSLPYKGVETYEVSVNADLKNISTRLPEPLNKAQGTPVPLKIAAKGDLKGFTLAGSLGKRHSLTASGYCVAMC